MAMSLLSIFITACAKENEQEIIQNLPGGGIGACDTANVKYASEVRPILQSNCYSCHGHGIAEGGITLDSYNGVRARADNGSLLGVITHAAGYPQMPKGAARLSDCNVNKIRSWINNGAQNN